MKKPLSRASSDRISEAITVTEEFSLSEGILHPQTSDRCGIRVLAIVGKNRMLYRPLTPLLSFAEILKLRKMSSGVDMPLVIERFYGGESTND